MFEDIFEAFLIIQKINSIYSLILILNLLQICTRFKCLSFNILIYIISYIDFQYDLKMPIKLLEIMFQTERPKIGDNPILYIIHTNTLYFDFESE